MHTSNSIITYKILNTYNDVTHFCTTRQGGVSVGNYSSFNLSPYSGDEPTHIERNKSILCHHIGIQSHQLVIPFQTHSDEIRIIDETLMSQSSNYQLEYLNGVDALITSLPNVCISVTTADCVPILILDPAKRVVAAIHAGWRGTCANIAAKAVEVMIKHFGCQPIDMVVSIGPSISANVYQVGTEVKEAFITAGFQENIFTTKTGGCYLDLWKANLFSVEKMGVLERNIEIAGICTYTHHERFFSARRLGIQSGRMLSGIMLK